MSINNLKEQNEIAFILDGFDRGIEISEKIKNVFSDWVIREIYWDEEDKVFFSMEGEKKTFYPFILNSKLIINLLDPDSDKYKEIEAKLRILKVSRIQNSSKTVFLFSEKIRSKEIFRKKNIKTPVFEKVFGRSREEIFVNFPQPAKISDGLVEEIIDGKTAKLFLYKDNLGEIFCLDSNIDKEILIRAKEIFDKLNIEKFAEMVFVSSEKRGIYLLNIAVDIDVLLKDEENNLKKIKKLLQ